MCLPIICSIRGPLIKEWAEWEQEWEQGWDKEWEEEEWEEVWGFRIYLRVDNRPVRVIWDS
jgi:hypothetical protein